MKSDRVPHVRRLRSKSEKRCEVTPDEEVGTANASDSKSSVLTLNRYQRRVMLVRVPKAICFLTLRMSATFVNLFRPPREVLTSLLLCFRLPLYG